MVGDRSATVTGKPSKQVLGELSRFTSDSS
jgi:hypothetical protein